jgi:hypothetical protein
LLHIERRLVNILNRLLGQGGSVTPARWKLLGKQMSESDEQRSIFIHGFDTFVDSSFIVMLHSCVESAFRSFYSSVYRKKTATKLYDVYKKLLHELNLDEYIDLLRLASNTRNSYHNNGIYTLEDDVIFWKNSTYYFYKDKNIELNVWYTFTIIATDILEMLQRVVKSDTICQMRDITDTSYINYDSVKGVKNLVL